MNELAPTSFPPAAPGASGGVILTGATGFAGREILAQALRNPEISGVTALTRRPLTVTHPKLRTVLHSDFTRYGRDLLELLSTHSACIWALGGKASDFTSLEDYARVTHDFTLALAREMAEMNRPFAFCYLSGMGADPSGTSWFPWQRETRCLKGRTERDLAGLHEASPLFTPYFFRPGGILPKEASPWVDRILGRITVRVNDLGRAMLHAALQGAAHSRISNAEIKAMAARV